MDVSNLGDTARRVTIGREHRDALYREIRDYELSNGIAEDMQLPGRGEGHDARQPIKVAARLLDDLGWAENDDRDRYTITMHARLLEAWARGRRQQIEQCLAEYSQKFVDLRSQTDPWVLPGHQLTGMEAANSIAALQSLIDQELGIIAAFNAILSQLEERR